MALRDRRLISLPALRSARRPEERESLMGYGVGGIGQVTSRRGKPTGSGGSKCVGAPVRGRHARRVAFLVWNSVPEPAGRRREGPGPSVVGGRAPDPPDTASAGGRTTTGAAGSQPAAPLPAAGSHTTGLGTGWRENPRDHHDSVAAAVTFAPLSSAGRKLGLTRFFIFLESAAPGRCSTRPRTRPLG